MHKIFYSHNFGHNGPIDYYGLGINGKLSELQAAMGLAVLPHMETVLNGYKNAVEKYKTLLYDCSVRSFTIMEDTIWNCSYFPVIFKTESALLKVLKLLSENKINARRYFIPSLNQLPYANSKEMPVSEDISGRILCLPLYHDISPETIRQVAKLLIDHDSGILP
jgi:dTDP-4-amino-4,6-dideoxygalactose transaminase